MSDSDPTSDLEPTHDFRPTDGWRDDWLGGLAHAEPVASILSRVVIVHTPASTSLPKLKSTSPRRCHFDGTNS